MELIAKEAVRPAEIRFVHSADMQFVGQTHILNVPLPSTAISQGRAAGAVRNGLFRALQGVAAGNPRQPRQPQHLGHRRPRSARSSTLIDPAGRAASLEGALSERRPVWFDGGWRETPVYQREKLPLDAVIEGPAILEQMDATTVVEPGDRAASDADGNLIIEIGRVA